MVNQHLITVPWNTMVNQHIPYYNALEHYGKPTYTLLQCPGTLW